MAKLGVTIRRTHGLDLTAADIGGFQSKLEIPAKSACNAFELVFGDYVGKFDLSSHVLSITAFLKTS